MESLVSAKYKKESHSGNLWHCILKRHIKNACCLRNMHMSYMRYQDRYTSSARKQAKLNTIATYALPVGVSDANE